MKVFVVVVALSVVLAASPVFAQAPAPAQQPPAKPAPTAPAPGAQQPPKPVKLEPAKDELGQNADAPPVPPKAKAEPVPRVIDQSERSPDPQKLSRFKIR